MNKKSISLTNNIGKGLRHHERARPVEGGGDRCGRSTDLAGQDLTHHQPRNGAKSERKAEHKYHERRQRKPSDVGHISAVVFHVEEPTERHQRDDHGNVRDVQEHLSAEAIDQQGGDEGRDKVHHTDDDRAEVLVDGGAGVLEDLYGVEDDGVDTGQLLEEHQAERDQQRLEVGLFEEVQHGALRGMSFGVLVRLDDTLQFRINVGLLSA